MRLKFWGVRGSIPVADHGFLRYGGNTSCVEVEADEGYKLIFDCGTGVRNLGDQYLRESGQNPLDLHIFFSHLHWDHTQGLPFFKPIFGKQNKVVFYGQKYEHSHFSEKLKIIMGDIYFPVPFDQLPSQIKFVELGEDEVKIGNTRITYRHLLHPGGCLGFRVENDGKVIAYCTDNEHPDEGIDSNIMKLADGADILVYDAQYTPEEYIQGHRGWGHSTWEAGIKLAEKAGVGKLVLFHHDPNHTDEFIDEKILKPAQLVDSRVLAAQEGLSLSP